MVSSFGTGPPLRPLSFPFHSIWVNAVSCSSLTLTLLPFTEEGVVTAMRTSGDPRPRRICSHTPNRDDDA